MQPPRSIARNRRHSGPTGTYRVEPDQSVERKLAGRDALWCGIFVAGVALLSGIIRRSFARPGSDHQLWFVWVAGGGALLAIGGLLQWRIGRPRVFSRPLDNWVWWLLVVAATGAFIASGWSWVLETFFGDGV